MKADGEEEEETTPEDFEYVVQRGDTLSDIARRSNIGVNLLRQLNRLEGDHIYPGQRLQIRPSSWMRRFISCVPEKRFRTLRSNTV